MKEAFYVEWKADAHFTVSAEIYIPDYYTRNMGLKGLWILADEKINLQEEWMETAYDDGMILFLVKKKNGMWETEESKKIWDYIQETASWLNGGFGILSAYRYLAGIGEGRIVAEQIKKDHGNNFAGIFLDGDSKDFHFQNMWDQIRRFRRIIYNDSHGETLPVRDMSHLEKIQIISGDICRSCCIAVPELCHEKEVPLVLIFHGITSNGEKFMEQTGWDLLAEKYGFIAAAPTGYLNRWNIGESSAYPSDLEFVKKVLESLEDRYLIDKKRIYLMGFSMGAAFVNLLQCRLPYTFAASAAFSGQMAGKDEDGVLLLKGRTRKENVYEKEDPDIPRVMWMAYGEEEKPWEYPGSREHAAAFWIRAAGGNIAEGRILRNDAEICVKAYTGLYGEVRILCQKHTGHAYHPELMEYIYQELFEKNVRVN